MSTWWYTAPKSGFIMHILFLEPGRKSSKKARELERATARSHAARISHGRAKDRRRLRVKIYCPKPDSNVSNEHTGSRNPAYDGVPQTVSIFPGFGNFRNELFDLLPDRTCIEDLKVLDFFVGVTLPGIDVASEVFNASGLFQFILPNLVSSLILALPLIRRNTMS